jgi:hypothetical protein
MLGGLEAKVDGKFDKVDARFGTVDARFDKVDVRFDVLELKFDRKLTWLLSLQLATTAGILGAMARGFGWI